MKESRVRVRRERPTALAWSIALAVTMLAVYALTWTRAKPDAAAQVSASPRVTQVLELEALEGWCVALGAWPDAERARVEAAGCAAQGAAGRVYESDGAWRVLGAIYPSERQAQSVAALMEGEVGVLRFEAKPVSLRVTAPERHIEWLREADGLLRDQAEQLSSIAAQLDRGELQLDAARTLCALAATRSGALLEKLEGIGSPDRKGYCGALTSALDDLSKALRAIAGRSSETQTVLAGKLRLAGIGAFIDLMAMREGLLKQSN